MPTYVYVCDTCQDQFEKFQSFRESPLKTCPKCQRDTVRRVFQPVGIVFKGSGWYITDSRSQKSSPTSTDSESNETTGIPKKEQRESDEPVRPSSSTTRTSDSRYS